MAKAPKPGGAGTTGGNDKVAAERQSVTMTVRNGDEEITRTLNIGAISFRERLVVRKATGLPFEAFLGDGDGMHVGMDTMQVWWWLAKRGENPMATLDQALAEWPDEPDADTFEVTFDDGEDDDPQS